MRRLLEILLSTAIGLLFLELGLRAWGMSFETAREPSASAAADLTILCVGDSNVFGLFEEASDSYPAQLEAALRSSGTDVRVINAGVPGTNTHQLARRLPELMERERPDLVLLTSGVNNRWAWDDPDDRGYDREPWYERLVLARFLRLARARLAPEAESDAGGPTPFIDRRGELVGHSRAPSDAQEVHDVTATVRRDLQLVSRMVRERGAELWVVGYGADRGPYARASDQLRTICEDLGVVFVDVVPAVAACVARLGEEHVFHVDLHPRPAGYAVIASVVADRLLAKEWLASAASEYLDPDLVADRQPRLHVEVEEGRPIRVSLENEVPGARYHFFVFRRTEGMETLAGLRELATVRECLARPELGGYVGADGRASLSLPASLAGTGVEGLELCYLIELRSAEEAAATGHPQKRYGTPVPLSSSPEPK